MASAEILQLPPEVLKQIPAGTPPPGQVSNLIDPSSRAYVLLITSSVFLSLGLVAFFIRLYAKFLIRRGAWWDDLTISLGFLGVITTYVSSMLQCAHGVYGKHVWDVSVYDVTRRPVVIYTYLCSVISPPTLGFLKLTIFLMYFQMFWPLRWLRLLVYMGASIISLFYGATSIYLFIMGTPRPGISWSEWELGPSDGKVFHVTIAVGIFGLIADVFLLALPVPAVLKLQMPRRKKLGVLCVFATGVIACVASGIGIYYRSLVVSKQDFTATSVDFWVMVGLEMNAGLIIVSAPSVLCVLKHHRIVIEKTWSKITLGLTAVHFGKSSTRLAEKRRDVHLPSPNDLLELERLKQHKAQIPRPLRAVTTEAWAECHDRAHAAADNGFSQSSNLA